MCVFTGVFRYASAERPKLRDIWPGVLVAAIGYELAKTGFALYLDNFANYGAVYASLAFVVAFLVFTYIVAFVALLGAEVAAEWPKVRAGRVRRPTRPAVPRAGLRLRPRPVPAEGLGRRGQARGLAAAAGHRRQDDTNVSPSVTLVSSPSSTRTSSSLR